MNTLVADAKAQLIREGQNLSELEALIIALRQADDVGIAKLLEQFHARAKPLPFIWDSDYGALVLESLAEESTDPARRELFMKHAVWRASWCASCATSGGEGTARMREVQRLEQKWQKSP